jgi:hypothetical protein
VTYSIFFLQVQYNKANEFAVLNIPTSSGKVERQRNQQFSSSSAISSNNNNNNGNEVIVIDNADDFEMNCAADSSLSAITSSTTVNYDKETLTLARDLILIMVIYR